MAIAAGTELGRYRIEKPLGSGGMGTVYAAYDSILRRPVALKVLKRDSPEIEARLLREARAAASLRHANSVAVYDIGEIADTPFIAMELVEGRSLRAAVTHATLGDKLGWLLAIARVLDAAHARGLIHRDIKPDNVMVGDDGTVKVLDFGIAKFASTIEARVSERESDDEPASFKTREGLVFGTPRYMAPEQRQAKELDGRADQYAWGVVALEMLCGVHPKDGATKSALEAAMKSGLPEDVATAIERTLEEDRARRFPSMAEIVARLEAHVTGPRPAGLSSGSLPAPEGESTLILSEAKITPTAIDPTRREPRRKSWLVALVIAIALAAAIVVAKIPRAAKTSSPPSTADAGPTAPLRIAVLPLDSAGSEPALDYLAEGATEDLIGELAHETKLRVVAHASVRQYRKAPKALSEVGRELDVGTVVTGTFRVAKGEARVSVAIVDVATQTARTTHTYTTNTDDSSVGFDAPHASCSPTWG